MYRQDRSNHNSLRSGFSSIASYICMSLVNNSISICELFTWPRTLINIIYVNYNISNIMIRTHTHVRCYHSYYHLSPNKYTILWIIPEIRHFLFLWLYWNNLQSQTHTHTNTHTHTYQWIITSQRTWFVTYSLSQCHYEYLHIYEIKDIWILTLNLIVTPWRKLCHLSMP